MTKTEAADPRPGKSGSDIARYRGEMALWRALSATARTAPKLREGDYDQLSQRAVDQRTRVESLRMQTAAAVGY